MSAKVKKVDNAAANAIKAYSVAIKVKTFNLINISFLLNNYF
jgi:hypothetical protein